MKRNQNTYAKRDPKDIRERETPKEHCIYRFFQGLVFLYSRISERSICESRILMKRGHSCTYPHVSECAHVCKSLDVCLHTRTCVSESAHVCKKCVRTHTRTCVHVSVHVHTYSSEESLHMYAHTHAAVCMRVHMCINPLGRSVHMFVRVCKCTHTHTYMSGSAHVHTHSW